MSTLKQTRETTSMEQTFEALMRRIRDKDPALTPQALEKEVAHVIGDTINDFIKTATTDQYTAPLQKAINTAFGLSCEVVPSLSLFVDVRDTSDGTMPITPFSSAPFENELAEIAEKDFSALSPDSICEHIQEIINLACMRFLHDVLVAHPLLTKIFQRFEETFHEELTILGCHPIKMIMSADQLTREQEESMETTTHFGTYL